jgi:hypothetical protein
MRVAIPRPSIHARLPRAVSADALPSLNVSGRLKWENATGSGLYTPRTLDTVDPRTQKAGSLAGEPAPGPNF